MSRSKPISKKITPIDGVVAVEKSGLSDVEKAQIAYANALVKSKSVSDTIMEVTLYRVKQDINRWRQSNISAENVLFPNRTEYYRLCKDVRLDTHLESCIQQRMNAVLAREVVLIDSSGEVNDEVSKLFRKAWFRKLLKFILEKKYYGFSLVDLGSFDNEALAFNDIKLVPRQYVRPEFGLVVPTAGSMSGVSYNDPKFKMWNPFFGDKTDLGLLMKIAPLTIWKKGAVGYWSEYLEKFGMPMRIGRTDIKDEIMKANMEQSLKTMGSAFYAMMDRDDLFELIQSGINGAWENYDQMISRTNSEISKVVLSQTGTTDEKAHVGSSNVHADVFANIVEADVTDLEFDLNEVMKPILLFHGFQIEELEFSVRLKESVDLAQKAVIDASFMPYVEFDKDYLEDTYGIKLSEVKKINVEPTPLGGQGEKKQDSAMNLADITAEYSKVCPACAGYDNKRDDYIMPFNDDEENKIIEDIYEGVIDPHDLPENLYLKTASTLMTNVYNGYGSPVPGDLLLKELTHNIYVFSAAKTYQQVASVHELLGKYPKRKDLFIKSAKEIFKDYNKTWLSAEADNAYGSALMARKWTYIEKDKRTLSFLEYQTAGDSRVRPTHASLDGIIRKVDDTFWSQYYPPNGWRCRCTTIQHHSVAAVTSMKGFVPPNDVPELFRMNVGKDGYIFKPDHPYFKVKKLDVEFAKQNFGLKIPQ